MTIATRAQVRAAVERALMLDPQRDLDAAVSSVAQSMGLTAEAVCEALEPSDEEVPA